MSDSNMADISSSRASSSDVPPVEVAVVTNGNGDQVGDTPAPKSNATFNQTKLIFDSIAVDGAITYDAFAAWFEPYNKAASLKRPNPPAHTGIDAAAGPSAKKAKSTAPSAAASAVGLPPPAPSRAPAAVSKPAKGKTTALLKGIIAKAKTVIKTKKFYNFGSTNEVAGETVMSHAEFDAIFGAVGTVPADVKTSDVVTVKYLSENDIKTVFGSLAEGITSMSYNKPRPGRFEKQKKTGSVGVTFQSGMLHYSSNTQNCKIKFHAEGGSIEGAVEYEGFSGLFLNNPW
jgi:hypothetical protein